MTRGATAPCSFKSRGAHAALWLLGLMAASAALAEASPPPALRDGQHDFDFSAGTWRTHIMRTLDPFDAASPTMAIEGIVTSRKVWGGRAWLEEIEADTPKGHWEGLNLFLYNPSAHQWSQSFSNSKMGTLGAPFVGEFNDGRAELLSQDTVNGKSILVRAVWSNITQDAHRYEEFYSDDGGRSWKLSFVANKTRMPAVNPR